MPSPLRGHIIPAGPSQLCVEKISDLESKKALRVEHLAPSLELCDLAEKWLSTQCESFLHLLNEDNIKISHMTVLRSKSDGICSE